MRGAQIAKVHGDEYQRMIEKYKTYAGEIFDAQPAFRTNRVSFTLETSTGSGRSPAQGQMPCS